MRKRTIYAEAAYILGILLLALGTAWMERGNFGMSMIVAPAYLLHLKISQYLPFFTFGMAEYALQFILILALSLTLGRFKLAYLFSVVTAVLYGFTLDLCIWLTAFLPGGNSMLSRVAFFATGLLLCTAGVAFLLNTYLAPEAYELVVKELSREYKISIGKCKTVYDCTSCLIAIVLSFLFFGFGHFVGISWGTMICTLLNGWLIGRFSAWIEKSISFRDGLPLRKYFL